MAGHHQLGAVGGKRHVDRPDSIPLVNNSAAAAANTYALGRDERFFVRGSRLTRTPSESASRQGIFSPFSRKPTSTLTNLIGAAGGDSTIGRERNGRDQLRMMAQNITAQTCARVPQPDGKVIAMCTRQQHRVVMAPSQLGNGYMHWSEGARGG